MTGESFPSQHEPFLPGESGQRREPLYANEFWFIFDVWGGWLDVEGLTFGDLVSNFFSYASLLSVDEIEGID